MIELIKLIQNKTNFSTQEAWWLLEHVTGKKMTTLLTDQSFKQKELDLLDKILNQITQEKKPLAYIIGSVPFLNLQIKIAAPILIPRHETEEWIESLIQKLSAFQNQITTILDIGTGSGCIALALAQGFPNAQITAIDINPTALALARENAILNQIKNVEFIESNLFEKLQNQKFDLIVSNPPYINPAEASKLPPEVVLWEDFGALFAKDQGLDIIVQILKNSDQFLNKNQKLPIQLVIEIGYDQKNTVLQIAQQYKWQANAKIDSFGKWRSIWAKK